MKFTLGKHWYLILIGSVILFLTLAIQYFKTTNCIAGWTYAFINDFSVILGVIASFTVIITAFIIFSRERRERKSYMLIDWVTDILLFRRKPEQILKRFSENSIYEYDLRTLNAINLKGKPIETFSYTIDKSLGEAVKDLRQLLKEHSEHLRKRWKGEAKDDSDIDKHRESVDAAAEKVLKLTAKFL